MSVCHKGEYEVYFTEMPLHSVLSEWFLKNLCVPMDTLTMVGHIILFFITWYVIKFIFRLVLSILWPLIIITAGLILFRIAQDPDRERIIDYLCEKIIQLYHYMVKTSARIPDLFQKLYVTGSEPLTW